MLFQFVVKMHELARRRVFSDGLVVGIATLASFWFMVSIAYPALSGKNLFRVYNADPDIAWLTNRGSKVDEDRLYVAFSVHERLPSNAVIQLWTMSTNSTPEWSAWTNVDERVLSDYVFADGIYGYSFSVDRWGITNGLQHQWILTTTYIRPAGVLTNGVLHANWLLPSTPTNGFIRGVPVHTGVSVDGEEIDLGTKGERLLSEDEE